MLEYPGKWRQKRTATGETRRGETTQNGHWRDQDRLYSREQTLDKPDEGTHYRMATGETR